MARSDIRTLIPLDRACAILGINPYHFNGVYTDRIPQDLSCDDFWFQYAYQRVGQASRDDLAMALQQAESLVADYLGFYPMPVWIEDEEHVVTTPYAVEYHNRYSVNSRGHYKSIRTKYGWVHAGGIRTKTLIQAAAAVTFSDEDGDGYEETASVTVATTATDVEQISVYFPDEDGDDAWEIRPVTVTISGGNATIVFPKYLIPLPELWVKEPSSDDPNRWRTIDGDVEANFLETVDVYRVYNDISDQATFYHESNCFSCNGSGCTACGHDTDTACLRVRDSRLGVLSYTPATWDSTNEEFDFRDSCYTDPEKILINYRAGYLSRNVRYPYKQMDPAWERAIVYFAFTRLDRADNICDNTQNVYEKMSEDLARVSGDKSYALAFKTLQTPLGTTRAAIDLWRMIEQYRNA